MTHIPFDFIHSLIFYIQETENTDHICLGLGDRKIKYDLEVTLRALTMHWRVILIILLLRRLMKSFSSRQKCTGQSVNVINRISLSSPFAATVFT